MVFRATKYVQLERVINFTSHRTNSVAFLKQVLMQNIIEQEKNLPVDAVEPALFAYLDLCPSPCNIRPTL